MINIKQGNGIVLISNTEEHGVTIVKFKDLDLLISELIQIKRKINNKN